MASFNIDNPLQSLEQSGLAGVILNDNAAPAANVIYSSLKSGGGSTSPATPTSLGTIQLAGALTGVATSPQLAPNSVGAAQLQPGAVTGASIAPGSLPATALAPNSITSSQLAPNSVTSAAIANGSVTAQKIVLGGPSQLFGSNSTSNSGQNITLDPASLSMSPLGVLSALAIPSTPATTTALGTVQLAGDLGGTGTVATAPVITNNAVTYGKMQKLVGANTLLGNVLNAANSNVGEVALGAGLSLSNPVGQLTINPASLPLPAATTSLQGAVILSGLSGSPPSDLTETTPGVPLVANNAVTYPKMQQVSQAALLGNSVAGSGNVSEITAGPGLSLTSTPGQLSLVPSALPLATTSSPGVVTLSGPAGAPPSDLTETAPGFPIIGANAVTYPKIQKAVGAAVLLGNSGAANSNYQEVTLQAGGGLQFTGSALGVNLSAITTGSPLAVAKGGTGAATLSGYLFGNGTSPITGNSTIPASAITPNLVGSVNGVMPSSAGGNVAILLGNVTTGTLAAIPAQPQPNGNIYVVSGDPTPANNGRTFISDGTTWNEVTNNLATTDARYVQLAGSTMNASAVLAFPSTGRVTLAQTSFGATDAITQGAVTTQIAAAVASGAPNATTSSVGLIQLGSLAFDPSSTATAPVSVKASTTFGAIQLPASPGTPLTNSLIQGASPGIALIAPKAVSLSRMADLSGNGLLLGSQSGAPAVSEIIVGTGLSMTGGTLSATSAPVVNATSSVLGVITLSNDLSGPPNTGGGLNGPTIGTNVVSYPKMQKVANAQALLGNSLGVANSDVGEVTLSSAFTFGTVGPNQQIGINPAGLPSATTSSLGVVQLGGDLNGTGTTALAPVISNNAVQYFKLQQSLNPNIVLGQMTSGQNIQELSVGSGLVVGATTLGLAPLSSASQLLGSANNAGPFSVTNISLGAGLVMTGNVLSVGGASPISTSIVPPATTGMAPNNYGGIQLNTSGPGALGGTASVPTLNNAVVTNIKMAPGPASTLKGTDTTSVVNDIALGPSMSMSAPNILNSQISFFNGSDPNSTAPTDRPATTGVLYYGTNGATWSWNGTLYVTPSTIKVSGTANAVSLSTVNAGLAQFGIDTNGRITLKFASGGTRTILTACEESDGLTAAPGDSSAQSGGTYGARQAIGTSVVLIGGTPTVAQRTKDQIGEGAVLSVYNQTDDIFYSVSYFVTAPGPPRTAYINVMY
jgi:hypothetical protein